MRDIVTCTLITIGFLLGAGFHAAVAEPSETRLQGTQWCLHGEYRTLKDYGASGGISDALVDVSASGVRVYGGCE